MGKTPEKSGKASKSAKKSTPAKPPVAAHDLKSRILSAIDRELGASMSGHHVFAGTYNRPDDGGGNYTRGDTTP